MPDDQIAAPSSAVDLFGQSIVFTEPDRCTSWPWLGHIPFAFWIVDAVRPGMLVELGTHTGTSYLAFCQAVRQLQLPTQCFAVDTWRGDLQSGFYGEEVFTELELYHEPRYGDFSRLIRSTFDEALEHFADRSIDLLHIDGYHVYEHAKHDFESWLPKLSRRGVVLLHDINVREGDFGAWRVWQEVSAAYPSFSFLHSHGLGVLAVGAEQPPAMRGLLTLGDTDPARVSAVRRFFERLGGRLGDQLRNKEIWAEQARLVGELSIQQAANEQLDGALQRSNGEVKRLRGELCSASAERDQAIDRLTTELNAARERVGEEETHNNKLRADFDRLREELDKRVQQIGYLDAEQTRYEQEIGQLRSGLENCDQTIDRLTALVSCRTAELEQVRDELVRHHMHFQKQVEQTLRSPGGVEKTLPGATALRRVLGTRPIITRGMRFIRRRSLISRLQEMRDRQLLRRSELFDVSYYLGVYNDVAVAGIDPYLHYLRFGAKEGRDPHPLFRTSYYLQHNADVAAAGVNPLVHYIRFGAAEGRQINLSAAGPGLPARSSSGQDGVASGEDLPTIVFVSGFPLTPSEVYRVFHPIAVLDECYRTLRITSEEIASHAEQLKRASLIVLFRVAWSQALARIIGEAHANGGLVVYDVDDYVFEPAIADANHIDGIRLLSEQEIRLYREGVQKYRKALEAADCCILSTEFLANKARELGKPSYVLPNSVDPGMLGRYDRALERRREAVSDGKLRIGYAAGTLTHQRDFAVVRDVLVEILTGRDDVVLTIVGQLDLSEYPDLSRRQDRIEIRPLVPHHELQNELARFDINIAPLEVGNPYCEAKSELKFFDAAFLEVPTVASATAPFRAAIRHGESGFVAETGEQWIESITRLLDDRRLRIRVGKLARSEALRLFGPGAMRENVKYVFEALLQRRRPASPRRGNNYDNFLYAINYQPAASALGRRLPANPRSSALNLHWIVPAFAAGWGGITNIFRIIQQLEKSGHQNTLWIHNPPKNLPNRQMVSDYYKEVVLTHFLPIAAQIKPLPADLEEISGDAVIATDHYSAYPARAVANVDRRFYFLQDHEPGFSPAGYPALFARATYSFGFDALSNGDWLHELAQKYGMWSMKWEQAADPDHYFCVDAENRWPGHIAFYARQETSRRAVELGYLAFELLAREGLGFHVDLFGSNCAPAALPYPFTHHGILCAAQLGELYRRASIGVVFSATNYSIIPREMMACGLPVVELNSESSRRSFGNGVVALADPVPESVAAHLKTLLLDRRRRQQLSQKGRESLVNFSWEKSARDIEQALLSRLGRANLR